MTNENILDAFGGINGKAVQDTKAYKRPKSKRWLKWGATAACLCLAAIGALQLWTRPALSGAVYAEVIELSGAGYCEVEVTEEDENFAQGDIIHVNYSSVRSSSEGTDVPLTVGSLVSITYTSVKKIGTGYEVTVPYVEVVTFPGSEDEKTEHNRQIYEIDPFKVLFRLPEGWSVGDYDPQAVHYLYNGVWSRAGVYDADGTCVGAVGYNIYNADEYVNGVPMSIYHQVALGNDYRFNVYETYTIVKDTEQYQTATVDVYYSPNFAADVGTDGAANYGILSYAVGQTVYVAFEFDHEAVTAEQVKDIASSVEFTFEE